MESNGITFDKVSDYQVDYKTRTIYLSKYHLKKTDKKILNLGDEMLYHIGYSSVKSSIKNILKSYEKDGYKVIFEHEGKQILLRFNR